MRSLLNKHPVETSVLALMLANLGQGIGSPALLKLDGDARTPDDIGAVARCGAARVIGGAPRDIGEGRQVCYEGL